MNALDAPTVSSSSRSSRSAGGSVSSYHSTGSARSGASLSSSSSSRSASSSAAGGGGRHRPRSSGAAVVDNRYHYYDGYDRDDNSSSNEPSSASKHHHHQKHQKSLCYLRGGAASPDYHHQQQQQEQHYRYYQQQQDQHPHPRIRGGFNPTAATKASSHAVRSSSDPYIRMGSGIGDGGGQSGGGGSTSGRNRSSSRRRGGGSSGGKGSKGSPGGSFYGKPKGLLNVGNTCYANAALQCLLSTALTHALIDPKASAIFRRYSSNPNLLEQGSGSVDSADYIRNYHNGGGGNNPEDDDAAAALDEEAGMSSSRRAKHRVRRRRDRDDRRMRENCTWLTRELKSITLEYQHPDPLAGSSASKGGGKSTSSFMSGWLSPSSSSLVVVDPGSITRHPDRLSKCLAPYQQEDAHEFLRALLSTLVMNGQNKQLSSLFDGLLESAVTCLHCRRPSLTRDRYMDLSLDICSPNVETLSDALSEFTKTETLSGDNKVYCVKCETKRSATKGLRLATAPSILVCHLKRFAFDQYGRLVRLAKRVHFPLRLEIGDYMSRVNKARPPPYELVAVLVHQGQTCDSGHYLAYVKNAGQWYKCNDSHIEPVDVATVLKQQAYILLYEVEEMRSKNGFSSPSTPHHSNCTGIRPNSSSTCRPESDWAPFLNGWREYLSSTSLCGMDDSLLREFCWDVKGSCTNTRSRRDGSVSGTSSGSGRNSSTTSRRRRRYGDSRDASNRSVDSCSHYDAHDDLSTLGESTVESADTSKIPFRRISSSGNLQAFERFRHHQYHQYYASTAHHHHSHHASGRPKQHFFANHSTSDPDALPDSYRSTTSSAAAAGTSNRPPWPATCPDQHPHAAGDGPALNSAAVDSSGDHQQLQCIDGGPATAGTTPALARLSHKELPPRPEGGATCSSTVRQQLQIQVPPLPPQQHRRSSSAGSVPAQRNPAAAGDGETHHHAY